jgi:hypothetical protein
MGEMKMQKKVLIGKPEEKRLLERPRQRWEDNIKLDRTDIKYDGVDRILLPEDRD